ncbi:uncharacterized protein [Euwallacea fornicatus]|uniref:uncharacterized protein n=1 Tax=Euwallacea fornicatus TaxID=995702 RepID=UPI003390008E
MKNHLHLLLIVLLAGAHESDCVRLTNMTSPPVQDPRNEMRLHCRFDMGGEQLYAVKWYKDDHEFFRYTPTNKIKIITYSVPGVNVNLLQSRCSSESCDLLLQNLTKPESSGAYRCEVSTEAPAFRLASETHNITMAALPKEKPVIEGLKHTYTLGSAFEAICTSGLGDPKPSLKLYINNQPVHSMYITEKIGNPEKQQPFHKLNLRRAKVQLGMTLERTSSLWNINSQNRLTCISSIEGLNLNIAPALNVTRTFTVVDSNQVIKNQHLHWPNAGSRPQGCFQGLLLTIAGILATFNYYTHSQ